VCQKTIKDWAHKHLTMSSSSNGVWPKYRTGEDQLQAFWRTLVVDCKGYPTVRLTPDDVFHDHSIFQEVFTQDEPTEKFPPLRSYKMLEKMMRLWRFYTTDNGLFVLAQSDTSEGDVVVILDGAKTPMVLRPTTDGSEGHVLYQPLNGAYVHGFMDGEVLKCKDEFKEQVFWVV